MARIAGCRFLLPLTFLMLTPLASFAQTVSFNLPAGPLAESLKAVGAQTNVNVLATPALVDGKQAPALKAKLPLKDALGRLLDGSGLEYHFINDQTVVIRQKVIAAAGDPPAQEANTPDAKKETGKNSSQGFRVAQADQGPNSGSSTISNAPASQGQGVKLEEIVVTAQKREERLIDVPISIAALGADELAKRNITSIDDLSLAVPGLSIQSSGSFGRQIVIRGVSNIFGTSSLVGIYLDESDVTTHGGNQLDLQTYDLERVEVLRGPQGTLYGEGSAGGTVRFITRNPQLNQFEMSADVAALFDQYGAPGQRIQAVVNAPLINDVLGLRVAGTFDHEGGWVDQPQAGVKNFNSQNLTEVRAKALWQPTSDLTISGMAVVHRNDQPPNVGENQIGVFTQVFNFTTTPKGTVDFNLYNLALDYDIGVAHLVATGTYLTQNKSFEDLGFRYPLNGPANQTPPYNQYILSRPIDERIYNGEIRLVSGNSTPWRWTIGAFARHDSYNDTSNEIFDLPGPDGTPINDPSAFLSPNPFPVVDDELSKSWAVFGDTSYALTNRFTLGAGVRYFRDTEENTVNGVTVDSHTLNPRAYLQYHVAEPVHLYASAAKGFRAGGVNDVGQPTYAPESVWTYELGAKTFWREAHLTTDGSIFWSNYTDYQIVQFVPPPVAAVVTTNGGNARIKGVEWATTWQPNENWSVGVSGDYLKTEFVSINDPSTSPYAVGDPLDLFPRYTFTAWAQRNFRWDKRTGFLRLGYDQKAPETYRSRNSGPWYYNESDTIHMLNFNSGLQWNDSLSFEFFVQNLLNDRGFLDPYSIESNGARARPRTFGIQFSVKFE